MNRLAPAACSAVLLLSLALPAGAAAPVGGGTYQGRTAQGPNYDVRLRITSQGNFVRRARLEWRLRNCERARDGVQGTASFAGIRIRDGRFRRVDTQRSKLPAVQGFAGGTQVERYRLRGRFVTSRRARGSLSVRVTVLNRAGQQVDSCSATRAIKFSARLLGVTDPGEEPDAYTLPTG